MNMVKAIALSTTSIFFYSPDPAEVKARVAKTSKYKADGPEMKELKPGSDAEAVFNQCRDAMIAEENAMNYIKRSVKGDASETGLIKFAQPILMKDYGGQYNDGLNDIRKAFPPVICGEGEDTKAAEIPFSSEIKFNMLIRDANPEVRSAEDAANNITIYIKGAPERILTRCSKIIEKGEELVFDEFQKSKVDLANDTFGRTGERVLAFAKRDLEPDLFTKAESLG